MEVRDIETSAGSVDSRRRSRGSRRRRLRLGTGVWFAALALTLTMVSYSPLVRQYSYVGMGNYDVNILGVLTSLLIAAIGVFLPDSKRLPGVFVIWVLATLVVIPALAVTPTGNPQWLLSVLIPLVGLIVTMIVFTSFRLQPFAIQGLTQRGFLRTSTLITLVLLAVIVATFQIRSAATLDNMYEIRAETEVAAGSSSPLAVYSLAVVGKVLAPMLTGLGVLWRKPTYAAFGLVAFAVLYLVDPSKTLVILPLLSISIAVYGRLKSRSPRASTIAFFLIAMVVAVSLLFPQPGNQVFAATVYRTLFVPVEVGLMWISHFSASPPGLFADAFPFISSSYSVSLPKYVSLTYGSGQGNINAELWVDGWANLTFWGVLLVSLVLGIVLSAINAAADGRDPRACVLVILGPTVGLTNGSLFTSLLSGGLVMSMFFILLLPRGGKSRNLRESSSGMVKEPQDVAVNP